MASVMHILKSFDSSIKAFGGMLMVFGDGGCGSIVMDGDRGVKAGMGVYWRQGIFAQRMQRIQ